MKKLLIIISGLIVLGVAYWLVSPLFITERVDEKIEDIMRSVKTAPTPSPSQLSEEKLGGQAAPPPPPLPPSLTQAIETISQGAFIGLAGHSGQGTAKLISLDGKYYVRLEDDFRVTNGPDLFVYFGKNGAYASEARLGNLKGNEGGQNYEVPPDIDPAQFNEVWIWCRAFSVPFAKAELR